jgi:hypothetical protein
VGIAEPADKGNATSPQWVAMAYLFGWDGPVADAFVAHGFRHVNATMTITEEALPLGQRVHVAMKTTNGTFDADAITQDGDGVAWRAALVAPGAGRASAIVGNATVTSRGNGEATTTWTGTSVLDPLGLTGPPATTGDDQGLVLDFDFVDAAGV